MPRLYFGSRGGVYYRKNGRRVYVSNRFGVDGVYTYDNAKPNRVDNYESDNGKSFWLRILALFEDSIK